MPVAPRHATEVPHLAKQAKVLAAERADIFSRRRAAGRCAPFLGRVGGSLHGGQEALGCALGGVAGPSRETAALGALRDEPRLGRQLVLCRPHVGADGTIVLAISSAARWRHRRAGALALEPS